MNHYKNLKKTPAATPSSSSTTSPKNHPLVKRLKHYLNLMIHGKWHHKAIGLTILLLGLGATLTLFRIGLRYIGLASQVQAQFYFHPESDTLNSETTYKVILDPKGAQLAFASFELQFNPNHLQLTQNPILSDQLGQTIIATSKEEANQTGTIAITVGLSPQQIQAAPKQAFEIVQLKFAPQTSDPNVPTQVTLKTHSTQLVDLQSQPLGVNADLLSLTVNYRPETPAPTTTPPSGDTPSGLITHFTFNENTGSTAAGDNNHSASLTNASWTSDGHSDAALSFSGNNSYATISNQDSLNRSNNSVTLAFWLNPRAGGNRFGGLVGKAYGSHYAYGIDSPFNPRLLVRSNKPAEYSLGFNADPDTWTHVAVTIQDQGDHTTVKSYKNGELVTTIDNAIRIGNTGESFYLGRKHNQFFQGNLDDLYIFDRALSDSEVANLYQSGSAPTVSLPNAKYAFSFNEGSGNASSSQTQALNGNLNNASWTDGKSGKALMFNGQNSYVQLDQPELSSTQFAVSAWIKPESFTIHDGRIAAQAKGINEQDHYWMLSTIEQDGQTRLRFRLKTNGNTSTLIANSGEIKAGNWYHVMATYDGSKMALYLNGEAVGEVSKTGDINYSNDPTWIGNNPPDASSRPFHGIIDELYLFDQVPSSDEIKALAQ